MNNINKSLYSFSQALSNLCVWVGQTAAWLAFAMVLVEFVVVILRYFFNTGWIWMQESVLYMHSAVFLFAAAYTLHLDGHVRVDIFYRRCRPRTRALVNMLGVAVLLLPVCGFIFYATWDIVVFSWQQWETSTEPGGLPIVYILKTFILVFCVLMILQGVAWFIRQWVGVLDPAYLPEQSRE